LEEEDIYDMVELFSVTCKVNYLGFTVDNWGFLMIINLVTCSCTGIIGIFGELLSYYKILLLIRKYFSLVSIMDFIRNNGY